MCGLFVQQVARYVRNCVCPSYITFCAWFMRASRCTLRTDRTFYCE
ncbi:hypothetical protein HMPREF9065_01777 [Aggregatibacter sp. oral taxon 458 str. W10330]|nr:hypothetical protein HMPREF9065_01777 [Aggregatibacter sp. oral taxon 458 str. W10330]